jgi:hypothetical protein
MILDEFVCTLQFDDDPLERTQRLPRFAGLRLGRRKCRTTKPGQALPVRGVALAEWRAWINGEEEPAYPCRRAVV